MTKLVPVISYLYCHLWAMAAHWWHEMFRTRWWTGKRWDACHLRAIVFVCTKTIRSVATFRVVTSVKHKTTTSTTTNPQYVVIKWKHAGNVLTELTTGLSMRANYTVRRLCVSKDKVFFKTSAYTIQHNLPHYSGWILWLVLVVQVILLYMSHPSFGSFFIFRFSWRCTETRKGTKGDYWMGEESSHSLITVTIRPNSIS